MSELVPFTFEGADVRALVIDDEPWWVAKDVTGILGYRMASDATRWLDDDEKGTRPVRTPGGMQELAVVNEPGLYSLIFRSEAKQAKAFKRWVTHEVLPQIRRTGSYAAGRPDLAEVTARNDTLIAQYKAGIIGHADAVRRATAIRVELGEAPDPPARATRPRDGDPLDRTADLILAHLEAAGGWVSRSDVRQRLWIRHRPHFDAAATRLQTAGLLDARPITHQGQPGTAYRAAPRGQDGGEP